MKILLVDDNRLMLEGLQNLLEAHDVQVAGMAADGQQAVALARTLKPDVILMDIRMPRCDGLNATRLIKAEMPEMKIVILTTSTDDQDLFEAVKSGASGYLLKSISAETLIEALIQAQEGIPPFSPGLAAKLLKEFAHLSEPSKAGSTGTGSSTSGTPVSGTPVSGTPVSGTPVSGSTVAGSFAIPAKFTNGSPERRLNDRQTEVLTLVSEGLSYKEVGARLYISPRTVRYHMVEIMDQLHMDNRAQVLAYAGYLGMGQDKSS
jgi:DNA-binding NarL/FixJ family response regulator